MEQLKGLVTLVQEAIENGATTVEDIHRSIASKPLDMLSKIAPLEAPMERVRQLQDETIGNIYETIRSVNAQVSELAIDLLSKAEKK